MCGEGGGGLDWKRAGLGLGWEGVWGWRRRGRRRKWRVLIGHLGRGKLRIVGPSSFRGNFCDIEESLIIMRVFLGLWLVKILKRRL